MTDAGMQMSALVFWMPMLSYAYFGVCEGIIIEWRGDSMM
jgi:hypothetical protein